MQRWSNCSSIDEDTPADAVQASPLDVSDIAQPVRLCHVGNRLTAVACSSLPAYLPPADGIVESSCRGAVAVQGIAPANDGRRLLLAGCDPALSFLSEQLHGSGLDVIAVPCSSRRALQWLKQGRVHAAGTHLLDRGTGEYNLPFIRKLLPPDSVRVATFAVWEQGLVVARGNPKGIRSAGDLAKRGVRLINREKGSGSRNLLEEELRKAGVDGNSILGYGNIAEGHLAAARAVSEGNADCCVAPRSAARAFGLDFLALAEERFDLCFAKDALDLPACKAVLNELQRAQLRNRLRTVAGYDTAHTGEVLI